MSYDDSYDDLIEDDFEERENEYDEDYVAGWEAETEDYYDFPEDDGEGLFDPMEAEK